jgi:hypothetical protein
MPSMMEGPRHTGRVIEKTMINLSVLLLLSLSRFCAVLKADFHDKCKFVGTQFVASTVGFIRVITALHTSFVPFCFSEALQVKLGRRLRQGGNFEANV